MGKGKAKRVTMEFTPQVDAALLRATAELRPHRQGEGKKLKQWQLVAQRVALELESGKGGDVSTIGCMHRYRNLVWAGRSQPKHKWPGDEELHKLLEEAIAEDAPQFPFPRQTFSESLLTGLKSSAKPTTPAADKATVTPPQPAEASEPVVKKTHKTDAKTGASPSKKRKHHHHHDDREEKEAAQPPPSKSARSSPKLLVLRLQRTAASENPEEGGEAPQWRFVGPEPKKPSKRHSPGSRKSPTKKASSEALENAPKPSQLLASPAAASVTPSRPESKSVSKSPPVPEAKVSSTPQQTSASKASSKQQTAQQAKSSRHVTKPAASVKARPRPAAVSISPCSTGLAASTAEGFLTGASSTLNGSPSPRHVFGDTMLVGELGRAVTVERMWLNMAEDAQSQRPNQVEADADQRDRESTTDESSRREIDELKQMVKSMAAALATSQKEQIELRKLITTSHLPAAPVTNQPELAQQVQQLTNALNQAQRERIALHQGLIGLQQQATQLRSSEIKLQREVTSLWLEVTSLKGTQLVHAQSFEDVAKERCAIEADIEDAEHRQQAAFRKFVVDEQLKRQELVAKIEKGRAKQKSNTQAQEESLIWFQEEMKRELDELRDSVERDVTVYDDLLDSVQEEHKAQLKALNAKISALSKPSKSHTATQDTDMSEELEELREELEIERHERQREYKALLRSIQRLVAPES